MLKPDEMKRPAKINTEQKPKRTYTLRRYSLLKCAYCGREFTAKRADAKYCTPTCRTYASDERNGYRHEKPSRGWLYEEEG